MHKRYRLVAALVAGLLVLGCTTVAASAAGEADPCAGIITDQSSTAQQTQWQAFLGKNRLEALRLEDVVASLRDFLLPVVAAANAEADYPQHWPAGGPWSSVVG